MKIGKIAYGLLFAFVLPLLLWIWAKRLDSLLQLPPVGDQRLGIVLAAIGTAVMAAAIMTLRVDGGGWPMSPYPPHNRVRTGPYAVVDDPIYAGAVLLAAGVAIAMRSAAGIWVVTPILGAACAAFVIGYEREATSRRFGVRPDQPLLRLPRASDAPPELGDRISMYVLVFLPWLVIYQAVNALGAPADVRNGYIRWDSSIPLWPWTELLYFAAYPMVLALPLIAPSKRILRDVAKQGWLSTLLVSTFYLVVPIAVPPRPVPPDSPFAPLMSWERAFEDPLTALPAFHVIWVVIAALAYSRSYPKLRFVWWSLAVGISLSCLTTGMHAILDVIAGFLVGVLVISSDRIWRVLLRVTERLANSWRERDFGLVRLMSHGLYAAMGAFAGIVIVAMLAGEEQLLAICFVALAVIIGAGLWAQFIEGSPALLRPYGYYGGILGGFTAIAAAPLLGGDRWLLLAAYSVASPVIQAFGRIRCLVQGCCHGRPAREDLGIRCTHPRSRVTRLTDLRNVPVHPTQLYSIVWNLFTFVLLIRLWMVGAPLCVIGGGYFILIGLGRFVEEHYRGEPQTEIVGGLRIYQWMAMASVVVGALLTFGDRRPAIPITSPSVRTFIGATVVAIITYCAYGVDFPRLNVRFARLV